MTYYQFFFGFANSIIRLIWRPRYRNIVAVPAIGAAVICANHTFALDPLLIAISISRPVHFLTKEELYRNPLLHFIFQRSNMIPVKRGQNDRQAMRTSLKYLNQGEILGVFPEGTRSKTAELLEFYDGAVYFAMKTGAPLIPAAIIGQYRWFAPMQVVYGEAITVEKAETPDREIMHHLTERLSSEIALLKRNSHGN